MISLSPSCFLLFSSCFHLLSCVPFAWLSLPYSHSCLLVVALASSIFPFLLCSFINIDIDFILLTPLLINYIGTLFESLSNGDFSFYHDWKELHLTLFYTLQCGIHLTTLDSHTVSRQPRTTNGLLRSLLDRLR